MFVFSNYKLVLDCGEMSKHAIDSGDIVSMSLDNKKQSVKIEHIDRGYIRISDDNSNTHIISIDDFLKGYIECNAISKDYTLLYRHRYRLSEHGKIYDVGDKFTLCAPLSDINNLPVKLMAINITLANITISVKKYMFDEVTIEPPIVIEEPLSLSRLPEPHIDIINLPQYYIV